MSRASDFRLGVPWLAGRPRRHTPRVPRCVEGRLPPTLGRVLLGSLMLAVAATIGACAAPAPTVVVAPAPVRSSLGDSDRALARFDAEVLLRGVKGGNGCQAEGGGGGGSDDNVHRDWLFTCPRPGADRTVYFLLSEAIEAELKRIATVPAQSKSIRDVPDPLSSVWQIRGEAYRGTVRALGVNGNGTLLIFVDLDLAAP